jgi:hypothetical protein
VVLAGRLRRDVDHVKALDQKFNQQETNADFKLPGREV